MATVLSHVHFCPACDESWTCVLWKCPHEGDELLCAFCQEKEPEPKADAFSLAITERNDRRIAAAAFRTGRRAFISKMFQTVLGLSTGSGLPPLKD